MIILLCHNIFVEINGELKMEEQNLVYLLEGKIYINLTNNCTNKCLFCIRNLKDDVCGANLWLKNDTVSAQEVISQLKQIKKDEKDIVFCGYGEPTLKLDVLKEVARFIKDNYKDVKIRVNTNGHANFVYERNILPELKGLVDEFSVSLNAADEDVYKVLTQPNIKTQTPLKEVKQFIKESVNQGFETTASVVCGYQDYDVKPQECEKIAKELGAKFRVREWLERGY